MGNLLCRQRLSLTKNELNQLKETDLNEIYLRFMNCYPYGYLTIEEFVDYLQRFNDDQSLDLNYLIKDLFHLFDLNQDQKLNFHEFILFNQLISNGTNEEKFEKIFELYQYEKDKNFNKNQLIDFLTNLFDLFQIDYSKKCLINLIQNIFNENHLKSYQQINWHIFRDQIQKNEFFQREILQKIIQRSERF